MKQQTSTILLLLLIAVAHSYTLDGLWKLEPDSSYAEINSLSEVTFDFRKEIQNGKIVNYMTVYACQIIEFTYTLDESDIDIQFQAYLAQRSECKSDERGQIRRRSQKVFYTVTIGNNILFLSPNGQTVFKLVKEKQISSAKQFSGKWNAFEIAGDRAKVKFYANGTQIYVCDGKGIISYSTSKNNQVQFKIEQTKGCKEYPFFTALYRSKFYRKKANLLFFYNERFQIIGKWLKLANFPSDKALSDIFDPNQSTDQQIQPQSQVQPEVQQKIEVPKKVQSNVQQKIQKQVEKKAQKKAQQKVEKNQIKNEQKSQVKQTIKLKEQVQKEQKGEIDLDKVKSKWFFTGDFKGYYTIIMSSRFVIYGGCNVYFTFFEFGQNDDGRVQVKNINFKSSQNDCGDQDDQIMNKLRNVRYLSLEDAEDPILGFLDKDENILLETSNKLKK